MSNTSITSPRSPSVQSVTEREAHRVIASNFTFTDEIDLVINEILADEELRPEWIKHNDPTFDDESMEGSVSIDKIRLADMVKAHANTDANRVRYPLIVAALTHRVKQGVQAALKRTGGSINQRRKALDALKN